MCVLTQHIDDICSRGKLPIVVGGNHYYIQSLIWDSLLAVPTTTPEEDSLDDLSTEKLYARLQEVDPDNTQHPNQRKRILADLRLFAQTGVPPSQLRRQQNAQRNPQEQLDNVVVWLSCGEETLRKRLDARVDSMVKHGLLEENAQFVKRFIDGSDLQRGVWQAIGLKEFLPLFVAENGGFNGRETLDAAGRCDGKLRRRRSGAGGVAASEDGHSAVCETVELSVANDWQTDHVDSEPTAGTRPALDSGGHEPAGVLGPDRVLAGGQRGGSSAGRDLAYCGSEQRVLGPTVR